MLVLLACTHSAFTCTLYMEFTHPINIIVWFLRNVGVSFFHNHVCISNTVLISNTQTFVLFEHYIYIIYVQCMHMYL